MVLIFISDSNYNATSSKVIHDAPGRFSKRGFSGVSLLDVFLLNVVIIHERNSISCKHTFSILAFEYLSDVS